MLSRMVLLIIGIGTAQQQIHSGPADVRIQPIYSGLIWCMSAKPETLGCFGFWRAYHESLCLIQEYACSDANCFQQGNAECSAIYH